MEDADSNNSRSLARPTSKRKHVAPEPVYQHIDNDIEPDYEEEPAPDDDDPMLQALREENDGKQTNEIKQPPSVRDAPPTRRTQHQPPTEAKAASRGRKHRPSNIAGDLQHYVQEYWKLQEAARKKYEEAQQARADLDHKHNDDEGEEAHEDEDQKKSEAEFCAWGEHAPMEAKVMFIKRMGLFSTGTGADIIAKYIITLEQINAAPNLAQAIWQLFGMDSATERKDTEYNIRCNLTFCYMLQANELFGTPFVKLTAQEWDRRVHRLQKIHADNVRWFKHMLSAKEARNIGRSVEPLYEGPIIDDESQENAGRDGIKETEPQKLLEFMFQQAGAQRLRRTEKAVYQPIITQEGCNTRCYEMLADLDAWIRKQVTPKDNFETQYHWLTKKGDTPRYIQNHLANQPDVRFPFLKRCRTLWSFRNGIYDANENKFYVYVTAQTPLHKDVRTVYDLPDDVCTAKYFNFIVPLEWFAPGFDYRTIKDEVKNHETIFSYQDYKDEDLYWIEAFFGRLQHDVGTKEDWSTAIHMEGPGKTGKSLVCKLIQLWYYATDIGLIGDGVEETFPDQHLIDKFIVMCMDVSREFGLSPTRFLLWCSGDWLDIHRKGKEAICMRWKAPTLWASNNKPSIQASGGAAKRRYFIIQFFKAVIRANSHLFRDAQSEIGGFIIKCSMAYHEKVAKYGSQGIYDLVPQPNGQMKPILPARFIQASDEYAAACSYADAFLQSPIFEYVKDFPDASEEEKRDWLVDEFSFKREFQQFSQRTVLVGVNKKRPPSMIECTETEFANALAERQCLWETQEQAIYGLRINADKAREMEAAALAQPAHKKGKIGQILSRPVPQPVVPAAIIAPPPVAARPSVETFVPPAPPSAVEFGSDMPLMGG